MKNTNQTLLYNNWVLWPDIPFFHINAHAHAETELQMEFLYLKMPRNSLHNCSLSSIHSTAPDVISGSTRELYSLFPHLWIWTCKWCKIPWKVLNIFEMSFLCNCSFITYRIMLGLAILPYSHFAMKWCKSWSFPEFPMDRNVRTTWDDTSSPFGISLIN